MREGRVRTHEELVPYLTQSRHMTCVHAAAQLGCLGCLKWMVEHIGLLPNEADTKYGATPLHYAANAGHLKVIKFLLPRLDKIQTDYDGASPLHDAAVQGHLACVQELLKSPLIHPEQVDNYGLTAAEWAEQAQESKCVKLIRENVKKSATLPKRKRVALKKEKETSNFAAAFSQYSDSAESYSSSPNSETYALLEPPVECTCSTPPDLPPRPPDTPRPSKQESLPQTPTEVKVKSSPSRHGKGKRKQSQGSLQSRESSNERQKVPSVIDKPLPPPPDSMLQSLTACINKSEGGDIPPPLLDEQNQLLDQSGCYYIHNFDMSSNAGKPVSAVPPFSHHPTPPSSLTLGHQYSANAASSLTTPPAPLHSFSTFSVNSKSTSASDGYQQATHISTESLPRYTPLTGVYQSQADVARYQNPTVHALDNINYQHVPLTLSLDGLSHTVNQITLSNHSGQSPHQPYLGHTYCNSSTIRSSDAASNATENNGGTSTPVWKQQILQQRAKKQLDTEHESADLLSQSGDWAWNVGGNSTCIQGSRWIVISNGGLLKLAEIAETPDWMKLIQERKTAGREQAKFRVEDLEQKNSGLAPWQTEVLRAGRIIPIEPEAT